ncbi:hypothetical protein [Chryseobacterium daeguense]|nr:hypothetical protein [Chryseobacterium daeguense]
MNCQTSINPVANFTTSFSTTIIDLICKPVSTSWSDTSFPHLH